MTSSVEQRRGGIAGLLVSNARWWSLVTLVAVLAAGSGLWTWRHHDSFDRTVVRQVRSEWRRLRVYAPLWQRTLRFSDLTKRAGHP